MGRIVSINISEKKGVPKTPIDSAFLKEGFGIVGDAHAGPGDRQVSLLSQEKIEEFRKSPNLKACIRHGSFGENFTTLGIDYSTLNIGDRIRIGSSALLEITKKGKECHEFCAIGKSAGRCIMPKEGVFAKVISGGVVEVGHKIVLMV